MNLHSIVAPMVAAVNPMTPVSVRKASGWTTESSGRRVPTYETPADFFGAIAGNVLTANTFPVGTALAIGQEIGGVGVAPRTIITGFLTGTGQGGTYTVNIEQTVAQVAMQANLFLRAQIQPVGWRDLQLVEGLNLSGTRRKFYLHGTAEAVERVAKKGGDLIEVASGVHAGVWLVAQVMEQFHGWVSVMATQQGDTVG